MTKEWLAEQISKACEAGDIELTDSLCVVGEKLLSPEDWAWVQEQTC